ncbi:ABC transporter permease [Algoriphagus aestuariicola]|uniref:ABC transporter permease n=1 Tax=Algoriphagus aestuariicola TaxID=1852016 RepID=A0ABS3BNG7_9BACT|nr:ABC transporter permease [Algoriphagus aestuariicola]MBN7800359.1 ABC transporter permease [Algoriphagus aestuariicola]
MLKNYFKIAWRNLSRNKLRTFIHVLGLSLGISICFLIFNLVFYSYSFDRFHPDGDRIFRINTLTEWGDGSFPNSGTPGPLGEVIQDEITAVEGKGRLYTLSETLVANPAENKVYGRVNTVTFADPGFFKIFPRTWLAGNPETALDAPNAAVISVASLNRYFPGVDAGTALGKELLWVDSDTIIAQVTGVVDDFGEKSDFIFTDFISYQTIKHSEMEEWYGLHSWDNVNSSSQLFVKAGLGVEKAQLDESLKSIVDKNYKKDDEGKTTFFVEPLSEMHFSQNYSDTAVSKVFLQGLIYIGLIILFLAALNFINLETAQAIGRAKEVGIRKTLGGRRAQLILQFLTETYLIVLLAMAIAVGLVEALRALFSDYLPAEFRIDQLSGINLAFCFAFPLMITLVSGIYPSLVLSGYQPQRALKGESSGYRRFSIGVFLRKNLTVLQFSASIAFVILVLVLNQQLRYVSSQPLGFEKEEVMYASLPFLSPPDKMVQLQDRLNQKSMVKGASLSGNLVSSSSLWTSDAHVPMDTTEKQLYIQVMNVDSAFAKVNGVPILAGSQGSNREDEILVNENFLKEAGIDTAEEALGLSIRFNGGEKKIVGVVANFHSRTLREEIRPLILTVNPQFFQSVTVKLEKGQNLAMAKQELEAIYKEIYPYETAEFKFLDFQIERFYQEDMRIRNVLGGACILAILISAMGLFGLSSYTIAQRTKEISIRKVLGASIVQILGLISKEYVLLVLVSFALAVYPAYYFLSDWLDGFTYKISMPYSLFGISGVGVLAICMLIVGLHSYVAAQINPAKVLKDE